MALIKCPECKNDVSNKTTVCIHCGYPLSELSFNGKKYRTFSNENVYIKFENNKLYDVHKKPDNSWDGLENGYEYIIEDNTITLLVDKAKRGIKYTIDNDIIFPNRSIMLNDVPNGPHFNATFISEFGYLSNYIFKDDGTCYALHSADEDDEDSRENVGHYLRNDNIIIVKYDISIKPKIYYIYKNKLIDVAFVLSDSYYKYEDTINTTKKQLNIVDDTISRDSSNSNNIEIEATNYEPRQYTIASEPIKQPQQVTKQANYYSNSQDNAPWDTQYYNYPCPWCGAYKVRPAKWEDKKLSVSFWGVFSPKTAARYKCDSCKEMWE